VCVRRENEINPDQIQVAVDETTVFLCWKKVPWIVIDVIIIIIIIIIIVIVKISLHNFLSSQNTCLMEE